MTAATDPQSSLRPVYDAVVVGSGLGGATLALRLGQRGAKVLLVERGGYLRNDGAQTTPPNNRYFLDIMGDRTTPINFVGGQTNEILWRRAIPLSRN